MASATAVKKYLAYWFQLGKPIILHNGRESLLPQPIFQGDRYSPQFEQCWQQVSNPENGDCYLQGTEQTIQQLLTPAWEFNDCARCEMPIPTSYLSNPSPSLICPCHDLAAWPNLELPSPRLPADTHQHLDRIRQRLQNIRQGRTNQ